LGCFPCGSDIYEVKLEIKELIDWSAKAQSRHLAYFNDCISKIVRESTIPVITLQSHSKMLEITDAFYNIHEFLPLLPREGLFSFFF
jgi:hypothetical protein